ncbi:uncharacterized protein LOC126318273 [Schistocerca gregaria]|uniref:uncharacterized protein LOC126318273 n=1 Tax=Schistocerca gregaria TaxID=7010 RepID=UPI00211DCEF8|nr:uncharacterized protein LOC126318273 [Schistocerca gregaria]
MLENGPGSLVVEDEMDNIEIGASSSRDKKTKASSSIQKYEDSSNMVLSCQVSNQTGDDIECYLFKHVREKNMTKRLSPGESASMPILVGRNQLENLWTDCMMDLSFPCKPMYQEILNVPISKTSVMAYGLSRFDQSIVLLVQVSFDRGNKQVVLRGNWTFFNATCVPLEIMLDYAQICKNGQKVVKSIDPRTSYSIPLEFTEVQSVRMRPKAEEEFDWFEMERDSSKQGELLVDSVTAMSYVHTTNRQSRVWAVAVREKTSRVRNNQLSVVDRQVRFSPYLTIKNMLYSTLWMKMVHTMCENLEASPPISLPILEAKDLVWFSVPKKAKESTAGYLSTIGLSIRIEGYAWSKPVELFLGDTQKEKASKKKEIPIKLSKEGSKRRLSLLVDLNVFSEGGCGLYVYADYWLINQTGLDVRYAEKGEVDRGEVGAQESSGKRMSRDLESSALDSKSDQRGSYKKYLDYGYAYNVYYYDKKSLSIKVGNSKWSKLFPIGIKNEGIVYVRDSESENSELYQFSVLVHPGPGRFWRTKVVQLQPACILVNRASMPLRYRQDGCDESYALGCGEQIPFHWPRGQKDRKLVVCDLEEKYTWSAGLLLHIVGECQLKLRDLKDGSQTLCLNLVIKLVNAVTFVVFGDGDSDKCPFVVNSYQITNNSSCHVVFYQDGCKEREYSLPPQESMPYYWDIVQLQSPILVIRAEAGKNKRMKLSLDEIGAYPDIPLYQLQGKRALSFEVRLVGAKRELVISDFGPAEVERSTVKPKVTLMAKMEVRGIGVSIIDTKPQEILYLTMQFIFLEAQMSSLEQTLYMKVRSMQVDNQLYFSPFPIMLYAVPKSELPFFQLSVVQDVSVPNQWQFKYFGMQIQEIDINLHDVCIFQTLAFSNFAIDHLYRLTLLKEERNWLKNGASDQIPVITDEDLRSSDIFYFRILHLNPVKVNLSFMATSEGRSHSAALSTQENAPSFLESFMGYFGFLTSIDRAPVRLNALLLQNVSTSHTELLNRIMAHYKMSVIKQGYKILGSADFLGNPVSLVSNLGTGVRDFFYEPAMGIVESPSAFGRGLAKGTKSLLLKTLYVLFDTTSRLTNTVAEAGVKATFDSDYQRKRAFRNQMPITDARQGMMSGIHGLTSGFYKGFSGVIMDPIRGTKEEGAVGFLKGVQTGLTGVILKPTIGIVDLVSRTAQGIKNNAALANNRPYTPVRLPRYFGEDHILTVYDPEKSTGQLILCYIEGRQDRASVYIAHFMVKKNCLLVTKPYLYFLKSSRHSTGHFEWKVVWREELSDLYLCTVCPPTDYIGDKRLILEDEEWFLKLRFNPPHLRTLKSGKPHCSHVIKGPSASIRQISNTLSQQGAKSETKILSEYLRDASKKKNTDHTSKSALSSPTSSSPLLSGNYNSPDFFKNSNRENQRQSFSDASEQAADQCCCCSKCSVL